jgi:hypothetical protein
VDTKTVWSYDEVAQVLAEARAVHPQVHTSARITNYLERNGWQRIESPKPPPGVLATWPWWSPPDPDHIRWIHPSGIELDAPLSEGAGCRGPHRLGGVGRAAPESWGSARAGSPIGDRAAAERGGVVTDLAKFRALAAAARADTTDGLTAREALPDVVDALLDLIGQPTTVWGARWRRGRNEGVEWRDDEQDAREFVASMPADARMSWSVVSRTLCHHGSPWVEVPAGAEGDDA